MLKVPISPNFFRWRQGLELHRLADPAGFNSGAIAGTIRATDFRAMVNLYKDMGRGWVAETGKLTGR